MDADVVSAWTAQVLLPAIQSDGERPPDEATLPGGGLALLSADTDRTQQFVFQSARLPEIRGASMRLDHLNRVALRDLLCEKHGLPAGFITDDPPGCLIYLGGGGLLALVPLDLAPILVADIERLYPQETIAATITAVYHPLTITQARGQLAVLAQPTRLPPAAQKRFAANASQTAVQRVMGEQALALRYRKQAKAILPHVEADPYTRQCQSCGRRPATDVQAGIVGESARYLCQVCSDNGRYGRAHKSTWNEEFEVWSQRERHVALIAPKAEDLQIIGKASKGYIGYIYADGNSIGKLLEQSASLAAYSHLSQQLGQETETAVYAALFTHLYQPQTNAVLPFEIITIGGDDVLLIVPAHTALPIAHDICEGFGVVMAALAQTDHAPSMSAGVVIAQDSNPIYFIHDLAHQLLKNAKKKTRQPGAHLDFMILKSQSTLATNLDVVRRSPYLRVEQEQIKERCYLTARPYALDDVDKLLRGARELKMARFAPGQLHQMRREFQNGRFPGLFYYLYQRTRLGRMKPAYTRALGTIEVEWGMVAPDGAPPWIALPSKDDYQEYATPLLDILELLQFVDSD